MFPLAFLFSLPDYRTGCIQSLHYLFSFMVQHQRVFSSLDAFVLVHSPHKQEAVFLGSNNTYAYCDLPSGFHIRCVQQAPDAACPRADEHNLYHLFHEVRTLSAGRHPTLSRLFDLLLREDLDEPSECAFCTHRALAIDAVCAAYQKPFPLLTRSSIEMFYRFPVKRGTDVAKILETHAVSMQNLFSQVRNPATREKLVEETYHIVQDLLPSVQQALDHNDDDRMQAATLEFKNRLLDAVDQACPFVAVRKIDFKRWLLTLFYFFSLQQEAPPPDAKPFRVLKKAVMLLHLYFHTHVPLGENAVFYVEDENESRRVHVSIAQFNKVHPCLRGEYLVEAG